MALVPLDVPRPQEAAPVSHPQASQLPLTPSKLEPLLRPLHAFLSAQSAGGVVLMVTAVIALAWANSPWGHGYHELWQTKVGVDAGGWSFAMSLEHWVNDGLRFRLLLHRPTLHGCYIGSSATRGPYSGDQGAGASCEKPIVPTSPRTCYS